MAKQIEISESLMVAIVATLAAVVIAVGLAAYNVRLIYVGYAPCETAEQKR